MVLPGGSHGEIKIQDYCLIRETEYTEKYTVAEDGSGVSLS